MLKYYSSRIFLFTNLSHFFCCGIPFLLSVNFLFSNIFIELKILDLHWLETTENLLFILSTLILLSIIIIEIFNRKTKSSGENCCTDEENITKERRINLYIIFSSMLYFINCFIFLSERIF